MFMDHSPYEILGNNVLPFQILSRIKQVEDVLEKYWNDHRMDTTIEYLLQIPFHRHLIFSKNLGPIGTSRAGQELGINSKICLNG